MIKFLKSLKLINNNWIASFALWGVLLTPLFFVVDFRHFPNFGKGLWFFSIGAIFIASTFFTLNWSRIKGWFKHPLVWILSSWILVMALSFIFSINQYVSFWGNFERLGGLITVIYTLLLLITLVTHLYKENALRILGVMSLIGGVVGLHAIGQKLGLDSLWFSFNRPVATFGNPIFLSTFLLMTVFIALYFILQSKKLWLKTLYSISFIAQITAIFLAMARGPVIGIVFGLIVFTVGFLWIKYVSQKKRFLRTLGITVLMGIVLLGGLYVAREPLGIQRLFNYSITEQSTIRNRLAIIGTIYKGVQERPWLGFGLENIYVAYNRQYTSTVAASGYKETFADRAHNVVIDQLASNGWLGLIAMLMFVIGLIIYSTRWIKRAGTLQEKVLALAFLVTFATYFMQDLVEFDIITNYVYGTILVALFFVLSKSNGNMSYSLYKSRWSNWVGTILLTGLSFYLIFGIYLPSWRGGILAQQAFEANTYDKNYNKANNYYNEAFKIESPWAHWYLKDNYPSFVSLFANITFKDNPNITSIILDDAIKRMDKFIEREPEDIQARFNHASLNVVLDDLLPGRTEGDRLFKQLLEENPNREFFYLSWGKSLYLSGRVKEGKERILQSMQFESIPAEAYFWLGVIEATLENEEEALSNFRQVAVRPMDLVDSPKHLAFALDYLLERGRYFDAIPFQKRLIDLNPKKLKYWLNLAVLTRDTGQTELARETAMRILELFPDTSEDVTDFINSLQAGPAEQ